MAKVVILRPKNTKNYEIFNNFSILPVPQIDDPFALWIVHHTLLLLKRATLLLYYYLRKTHIKCSLFFFLLLPALLLLAKGELQ